MADQNNRVECRMLGGVCACSPGSCVVGLAAPAAATPAVPAPALTRYYHGCSGMVANQGGKYYLAAEVDALLAARQSVPAPDAPTDDDELFAAKYYSSARPAPDVGGLIPEQAIPEGYVLMPKSPSEAVLAPDGWPRLEWARYQAMIAAAPAPPADPEQAKLDSLAQAGLAAALGNRAKGEQKSCDGAVAVEVFLAEDGVDGEHPSYGRGVFFTLNCMKEVYVSQPQAAPEATDNRPDLLDAIEDAEREKATSEQPESVQFLRNVVNEAAPMLRTAGRPRTADLLEVATRALEATSEQDDELPISMSIYGSLAECEAERARRGEQMGGAQVESDEQRALELDDRYRKGYSEGWTDGRHDLNDLAAEGAATSERKPLTDGAVQQLRDIGHTWMAHEGRDRLDDWIEQHHGIGSDK